jgi:hypothetical protein
MRDRRPHCGPLLTLRTEVFRSAMSSRGQSRRFHDVRNESVYPSVAADLRHRSELTGCAKGLAAAGQRIWRHHFRTTIDGRWR